MIGSGFRRGALGAALTLFSACGRSNGGERPVTRAPSATGWVVATEDDTMRVSVDTAGWRRGSTAGTLWIAINDVSTPERRRSDSPFFRFETRQEVDCAAQRARGLDIRTPDSSGTPGIHPVRDSAWRPFATARLPRMVLVAVCGTLSRLPQ